MLLVDVDVGDGALTGDLLECVLELLAIICVEEDSVSLHL